MTKMKDDELSTWFSTYGYITIERIFDLIGIHLSHKDLVRATNDPTSVYYQILRVPLKNILNGIILNQVMDYREYAQKLFIDYLMSGAGNENTEGQLNGGVCDALEEERLRLIELGDEFDVKEYEHFQLIGESQNTLIELAHTLPQNMETITQDAIDLFTMGMTPYLEKAEALTYFLRKYRTDFYDLILRTQELIKVLPDYHIDTEKQSENKSTLYFDSKIGDEKIDDK